MKKIIIQISMIIAFINLISLHSISAQEGVMIMEPEQADIIKNKQAFKVETNIDNFDLKQFHYWVALATVKNADSFMPGMLSTKKDFVLEDMKDWELDQIWPKYYVKGNPYRGDIFDGGSNPSPFLQPMCIVIIKVDDQLNGYIINWFKTAKTMGFPGIKPSVFRNMIISKQEIFFP